MTSADIRQSYLDFFRSKQHTIVPSSSLMPDSPNLLFTNAGMNQFVPIFLGQTACPYTPGRAADTQKCIRAGGKHNDLEDVGLDTYHHTFFEMLGNWSFGDYFKQEAIAWAWELVVGTWKFPASRVYATVYKPGPGDPAEFDQEAYDVWLKIFTAAGVENPQSHVVYGNKKDNFWMMGETGPCGPCSELHIDLTPEGDTQGKLVNQGDARCIEIWNLVFIQFNANPDGTFSPLPAKHVDTGMGFERVCSIIQGTKGLTNFKAAKISNYETDVFRPIFDEIGKLSGKKYTSTLPKAGSTGDTEQEKDDVAFRVIADHIRTLSFSIADGIQPSNEGRGYVLRRILRRAVKYGRQLGFKEPFFWKLTAVLAQTMGDVFPEIRREQGCVEQVIRNEEESFSKTLDRGIELFNAEADLIKKSGSQEKIFSGTAAFKLYDTYGFPIDLTQLMAREQGLEVDAEVFERLMEEQRQRSQSAQKKEIIGVLDAGEVAKTHFTGYDELQTEADVVAIKDRQVVLNITPFYAEMGGQVGDAGVISAGGKEIAVKNTQKNAQGVYFHDTTEPALLVVGDTVVVRVDETRRGRIEAHHSGTHLMHWALRLVAGTSVGQKGSYVGPDRLRFDFSHGQALTPDEVAQVESMVNEKVSANDPVEWKERPYAEVKGDTTLLQFFGDKYGDVVRVVDIGGYSKELCGGTHVRQTGKIGFFKIISEGAIAAGVRRIEAVAGPAVVDYIHAEQIRQEERYATLKKKRADLAALRGLSAPTPVALWEEFTARQEQLAALEADVREWDKQQAKLVEAAWQRQASAQAAELIPTAIDQSGVAMIIKNLGAVSAGYLPVLADAVKVSWKGVLVLASAPEPGKVALLASVAPDFVKKLPAGKIIQTIAPVVGGKGGGRPDLAQGGGTLPKKIDEALEKVKGLV